MQDLLRLIDHLSQFRRNVILSVLCHILMAVFTIVSIPLIIPFFQILFSRTPAEAVLPTHHLDITGWLNYYSVKMIGTYGPSRALFLTCLVIVAVFLLKNLFRYLAMYTMVPVRSGIVRNLRSALYDAYVRMDFLGLKTQRRGDLITRISSDVQEVEWSILRFVEALFKSPIIIIGSVFFMFTIHVGLTFFVFVLMLFTAVVIGSLSRTLKRDSLELQGELSKLNTIVDETLDGHLPIAIFGIRLPWIAKFEKSNETYRALINKVLRRKDLSSPLSEFLGVSVVVVLLFYGSRLVLGGDLEPEVFFAFIFAFYNVIEPSKSFSMAYYNIKKGLAALERIDEILDTAETEPLSYGQGDKIERFSTIEFRDVSFMYPGEDKPVLAEINFKLHKDQKVALIGASGSGKTTMILLLLKVIKPTGGRILIDGSDLQEIDTGSWRSLLGLVTQEPFIFNDTLEKNITFYRPFDVERLQQAIEAAHAPDIPAKHTSGLQTMLGDKGARISGGEKQRITIARAMMHNPSLLVFDEPTSALDAESEQKVIESIVHALKNRTAIIIAHRISTVKNADRILVIDKGRVVEDGDHQSLIQNEGLYKKYVSIQDIQ